jgi:hypothetical protein
MNHPSLEEVLDPVPRYVAAAYPGKLAVGAARGPVCPSPGRIRRPCPPQRPRAERGNSGNPPENIKSKLKKRLQQAVPVSTTGQLNLSGAVEGKGNVTVTLVLLRNGLACAQLEDALAAGIDESLAEHLELLAIADALERVRMSAEAASNDTALALQIQCPEA